jgi:hypothetical protein
LHEPWQIIIVVCVTSAAGILGGVAAILSARRAKDVKEHLTTRQTEEQEWRETNIGKANGHGSLMRQMTITMERTGQLAEHVYELKNDIADVRADMVTHIGKEREKLEDIRDSIATVEGKLVEHVMWEESQKYPQPWDGAERRSTDRT